MKAKELMIGDWVRNDLNQVEKVFELRETQAMLSYNDLYDYDDLEPIPLTVEIIDKNGIEWSCNCGFFKEDKNYYLELTKEKGGTIWWSINLDEYSILELEYVHQLQNALRLCGINKEIIL